jgi:ElaB/YqjD/DUF883 family membrane-anchored ribosome-binding protein
MPVGITSAVAGITASQGTFLPVPRFRFIAHVSNGDFTMALPNQDHQATRSSSNGGNGKSVGDDIDALRSDIASLANSVSKLAGETFGTAAADAQAVAGERLGDIETAIRRNPTQAAMIAVGVGFLAGLILTR